MIRNDAELELVRQQVARLETAIHSFSKTVRPRSERNFRVMIEGHVDHLWPLRREIDDYLGISAVPESDPADSAEAEPLAVGVSGE